VVIVVSVPLLITMSIAGLSSEREASRRQERKDEDDLLLKLHDNNENNNISVWMRIMACLRVVRTELLGGPGYVLLKVYMGHSH
jgi:hypothetical protein